MDLKRIKDENNPILGDYKVDEQTLEVWEIGDALGFIGIKRNKKHFSIKITAKEDFQVEDSLRDLLEPYLKGHVYMTVDACLIQLKAYIDKKGMQA